EYVSLHDIDENRVKDLLCDKASALLGATGLASHAAGADVEPDPLATNFGIRYGNWKPDFAGGNLSPARISPRLFTEERVSGRGIPYAQRFDKISEQPQESNIKGDVERYVRGQLRPGIPAMLGDYILGSKRNFLGEDISKPYEARKGRGPDIPFTDTPVGSMPYSRWIAQQFSPSYPSDIIDIAQDNPKLLPLAI